MRSWPFVTSWWDYFLEKTDPMTETSGIKDCIDKEETAYFKKLITNIIYRLSQLRANRYGYQVFIEGRKLEIENFECIKKLIDEINIRVPLSVTHLLTFKDEGWDDEIGLYILSLIYKNQGIVITKWNGR